MQKHLIYATALATFIASGAASQSFSSFNEALQIKSYKLVSSQRVGRTEVDYLYEITIENESNADLVGLQLTVDTDARGIKIIDDKVDIGAIASFGTKTSSDTITVRVDRTTPFAPNSLIAFFDTPNRVAGVDMDRNGIRDDVEKAIKNDLKFNSVQEQEMVESYARLVQRDLERGTQRLPALSPEDYWEPTHLLLCLYQLRDDAIEIGKYVDILTYNTRARRSAGDQESSNFHGSSALEPSSVYEEYCRSKYNIEYKYD